MSIKSNRFDLLRLLREEWSTFIGLVPNKSRLRMQNIKLEVKFRAAPPSNNHSPSSSLLMPHSLRFNENKAVSDTIAQVNTARDTVLMAPRIKTNLTIYKEGNDILQMKWASKEVRKDTFVNSWNCLMSVQHLIRLWKQLWKGEARSLCGYSIQIYGRSVVVENILSFRGGNVF